jgi:hypothetical protein
MSFEKACQGFSKKNGGLNKAEIQARAVKKGLAPTGTRNELLRRLCQAQQSKIGWSVRAPKTIRARRKMLDKCGTRCFLNPEKLKFPVCADDGRCRLSRAGVIAAKKRAAQWGYTKQLAQATRLLQGL